MSTYEKLALAVIGVLLVVMIGWSYNELEESPRQEGFRDDRSDFDKSFGQEFKIGSFTKIVSMSSSNKEENDCEPLEPVIVSVLHDIKERLEVHEKDFDLSLNNKEDAFEINEEMLKFFCNTTADVTLSATDGKKLFLRKLPFSRGIPTGGTDADIGTEVRIQATIIPRGETSVPAEPTVYGDTLIPDQFLDITSPTSP